MLNTRSPTPPVPGSREARLTVEAPKSEVGIDPGPAHRTVDHDQSAVAVATVSGN